MEGNRRVNGNSQFIDQIGVCENRTYESGNLTVEGALNHPVYWESAPNKNEYGAYEAYQQKLAKKMGMTPADCRRRCVSAAARTRALGAIKRRSCVE